MILIYGGSGFVGSHIVKELKKNNLEYILSSNRIYNYTDICYDIETFKPTHIISAAGFSTPTTIDFYETRKNDLFLTNTIGNLLLADISNRYSIHLTIIMSGCIYNYPNIKNIDYYDNAYIFDERDMPNFYGSYYSKNRIKTEELLNIYDNVCILRLRMPISNTLHPKSLISKIIKYKNVIDIPNSMSVLEDVIPFINIVINKNLTGKYNLVNDGVITHSQILKLYKFYVSPSYNFKIITENEQNKNLLALRSNCHISNEKVSKHMPIPTIFDSIYNIFQEMSYIKDSYNLY